MPSRALRTAIRLAVLCALASATAMAAAAARADEEPAPGLVPPDAAAGAIEGERADGGTSGAPEAAGDAAGGDAGDWRDEQIETITIIGREPETATSSQTVPAANFELRPLESGGQMLEAVPNVLTAQHTGGGKAEQYFLRGFDADHGTAYKGPYYARYGDFATAATIEYVPRRDFDESFARVQYGEFDTFRAVGVASPRVGAFADDGPARGYLAFEAYHTDGPFVNEEDLWRYSALARGEVDVTPDLRLSGHLLGYHADWNASGLIPQRLVESGMLDRFGSLDPTEGGDTTRVQGKVQLDWYPWADGHLMANWYLSYYDFELFSNFTYFLNDPVNGDGIVQQDRDRVYTGGRIEYVKRPEAPVPLQLRGGVETRYDDARVFLGNQTRRTITGTISDDAVQELSLEPYADLEAELLPWLRVQAGLRFAWLHVDGRDELADRDRDADSDTRWLPKLNIQATPFAPDGPLPVDVDGIRELALFGHFGIGYHSNDARAAFADPGRTTVPRATGGELGARTRLFDRVDLALDGWILQLEDELVFVGDEGTTESAGETRRIGVEFATTLWLCDWWYARGDVAYTSARLVEEDVPLPQAPRFVAKASTGVRYEGFAAELNLRHLGERYATEDAPGPRLRDYTVLDFAARYRVAFIEIGFAIENITDTEWSSSEFFYESRPTPGGAAEEDLHFSPGNPRNVRAWVTGYF